MKLLSQRDPSWSSVKLGQSQLTLGRWGCTTTSMSMLTDYFGGYVDPPTLAHNVHNYTLDGLVNWKALSFPTMRFEKREYGENMVGIQNAIRDPRKAVILQVNQGAHWVVAIRKALIGSDILIADPWDGTKCWAKKRYHDISGAAYFSRK